MTVILLGTAGRPQHRAHAGRRHGRHRPRRQGPRAGAAWSSGWRGCRSVRSCASPLLRCRRTVAPLAAALGLDPLIDERISEVDYGKWTGRTSVNWSRSRCRGWCNSRPSGPSSCGEGLAHVQSRGSRRASTSSSACRAARRRRVWVACTDGDVIKAVVADALGTHSDSFQRIYADPSSMKRDRSPHASVRHPRRPHWCCAHRRFPGPAAEGRQ